MIPCYEQREPCELIQIGGPEPSFLNRSIQEPHRAETPGNSVAIITVHLTEVSLTAGTLGGYTDRFDCPI